MPRGALLALLLISLSGSASAEEKPETVYYHGIVASVNHESGEFVLLGGKDDLPDDLIVKLKADPSRVRVVNAYEGEVGFRRLSRGDQVEAECSLQGEELSVDAIYVFGIGQPALPTPQI